MTWNVETLDRRVDKEIQGLPADIQASLILVMELIAAHGPEDVGMPHVRHVEGRIWELRAKGRSGQGRGLFIGVRGKRVVILAAFQKKSRTTPRGLIDLARRRLKDSGL